LIWEVCRYQRGWREIILNTDKCVEVEDDVVEVRSGGAERRDFFFRNRGWRLSRTTLVAGEGGLNCVVILCVWGRSEDVRRDAMDGRTIW